MAAPTYATDLSLIDDAQAVGSYLATGGGAAALNDETDYFINGTQCISKNGFTATQKGIIHDDVSAPSITAGDAVFIWARQANRNILDTVANSGGAVIMGTSNSVFAGFNVDGNNVEGSNLLSWVCYAVDPTQTNSYTSGSPGAASTWDHFGFEWKILGSGSLKGAPNAVGIIRHGRELTCVDGDLGSGYATFDGAAVYGSDVTRRWGILYPVAGGYQFHGCFVMGTTGTAVDFRDADRNIVVLEDPFVPSTFNEFEIRNASSNVEWTNIIISHLGTTSPTVLTLDVGTFIGDNCQFNDCGPTVFSSAQTCINTVWTKCGAVTAAGADLTGSKIIDPSVTADNSGLIYNVNADPDGELDNMTFEKGSTDTHAIEFGTSVPATMTLRGCNFVGYSASDDVNASTFEFLDTSGTITLNLVNCTGNVGVKAPVGLTVNIVQDPVTTKAIAQEVDGTKVQSARVFLETDTTGPLPYQDSVSITQSAGTATVSHTAHGLATGQYVVIRGATQEEYNRVAQITVTSVNAYTYAVDSGAVSPATGSPVASAVICYGLTDVNGEVTDSRTLSSNQDVKGWIRKTSSAPYYKTAPISGTISNTTGATFTGVMIED